MVRRTYAFVVLMALFVLSPAALAQDASDSRRGPQILELSRQRAETRTAIEDGTHTPLELAAFYRELAILEARLGDAEAARAAFTAALALNPSLRIGADLAAEVRSPFMEAKGFWSGYSVRLEVAATLDNEESALVLSVTDPIHLCARVRLRARRKGELDYRETVLAPQGSMIVPLSGSVSAPIEYNLALLDEHGNRIFQAGRDERPLYLTPRAPPKSELPPIVAPQPSAEVTAPTPLASHASPPEARRSGRPYYFLSALSLTASGAALSGGLWAHMKREKLADDWNRGTCKGSGITRGTVCASEREELSTMDRLALGLYAGGGALLVTGVVLLFLAPSSSERKPESGARRTWFCTQGPGHVGLGCAATF